MLDIILSLHPLYLLAIVLGSVLAYFPLKKLHVDYQIRRLGGVRSGIIATNPITGECTKWHGQHQRERSLC